MNWHSHVSVKQSLSANAQLILWDFDPRAFRKPENVAKNLIILVLRLLEDSARLCPLLPYGSNSKGYANTI